MSLTSQFGELLGRTLTTDELNAIHDKLAVGFANTLGLRYTKVSPDEVQATFQVAAQYCQPMGLLHGGVYASLVEDVASVAASWWLAGRGLAVGANNSTDFIRPLHEGKLTATATPIHRGRSQQLWQVEIVTEDGKLAAQGKLRLSNIAVESHS